MNAIDVLEKHHRQVDDIFYQLEAGRAEPASLVIELATVLAAHQAVEQYVFYPELLAAYPEGISESLEEHALAELAVKRLLATDPSDSAFKARVVVTRELILHHVVEEEHVVFELARETLSTERLEALGYRVHECFEELRTCGYDALLPAAFAKTTADTARRRMFAVKRVAGRAA